MKQIVVAGAGGFGREVIEYISRDIKCGALSGVCLKGVLDDNPKQADGVQIPYLGTLKGYVLDQSDVIVIAIGVPKVRRSVKEKFAANGARFISYIHSSCYIANDAKIETGVIICPNSIVNAGAIIEDFSVINVFCSIGHGAHVGSFSVLSPYAALNGDASIGSDCFLGTRSTIFPRVRLGNSCTVDSHSYVKKDTSDKQIVTTRSNYVVINNRLI